MITNSPGTHVIPMADYTIGVMISLAHRFLMCYEEQKLKFWSTENQKKLKLQHQTINILYSWDARSSEWKQFFLNI